MSTHSRPRDEYVYSRLPSGWLLPASTSKGRPRLASKKFCMMSRAIIFSFHLAPQAAVTELVMVSQCC